MKQHLIFLLIFLNLHLTASVHRGTRASSTTLQSRNTQTSSRPTPLSSSSFPLIKSNSYAGNMSLLNRDLYTKANRDQECMTDIKNPNQTSSKLYRTLAYEALKACKHPYPGLVLMLNSSSTTRNIDIASCGIRSVNRKQVVSITMNEQHHTTMPYGVIRTTELHEGYHAANDHYNFDYSNKHQSRVRERSADESCLLGKCWQCALETAKYYFERNAKHPQYEWERKYPNLTYAQISRKPNSELNILIIQATHLSELVNDTHPLYIERALRHCRYRRILAGRLCVYHASL